MALDMFGLSPYTFLNPLFIEFPHAFSKVDHADLPNVERFDFGRVSRTFGAILAYETTKAQTGPHYFTRHYFRCLKTPFCSSHNESLPLQLLHSKVSPKLLRARTAGVREVLCVDAKAVGSVADAIALPITISLTRNKDAF